MQWQMKSSLNSLMTLLSPYSDYRRRGDNCKAIVANKQTTTKVRVLDSTLLSQPTFIDALQSYSTKSKEVKQKWQTQQ